MNAKAASASYIWRSESKAGKPSSQTAAETLAKALAVAAKFCWRGGYRLA